MNQYDCPHVSRLRMLTIATYIGYLIRLNETQSLSSVDITRWTCVCAYALRHDKRWGRTGEDPSILNLATKRQRVVDIRLWPLDPEVKSSRHTLDRTVYQPQSSRSAWWDRKSVPNGNRTPIIQSLSVLATPMHTYLTSINFMSTCWHGNSK
jgi:hypothetical protein